MNRLSAWLAAALLGITISACARTQPVLEKLVVPGYPELARQARVEGELVVGYSLSSDGSVSEAMVLSGSHPLLDRPLVEAVLQWRFNPAGLPSPTNRRIRFRLRLEEGQSESQWSVFTPPDQIEIVAKVKLMGPRSSNDGWPSRRTGFHPVTGKTGDRDQQAAEAQPKAGT